MVKGYVKNKIKQTAIKAIDNAVKNNRSEKENIKDAVGKEYTLFVSDKQKYSLKDLDKDIKIVNKFLKTFKSHNIIQIYQSIEYLNKNKDNELFSPKGKYNVNLVYRNIIDYARIKGETGFYIDSKTLDRAFNDLEIKAEKQYEIMLARMQKSLTSGYLDYDIDKKAYIINTKGEEKIKLDESKDNLRSDGFIIALKYIKKNGGSISSDELAEQLKQRNINTVKKYCEKLYEIGYLKRNIEAGNTRYIVTEKAEKISFNNLPVEQFYKLYKLNIFDKIIFEVSQKNQGILTMKDLKQHSKQILKELHDDEKGLKEVYDTFLEYSSFRLASLAKSGLLNYRIAGRTEYYQATSYFYNTLKEQQLSGAFIKPYKTEKDFEIKKFHYEILKDIERMSGLNPDNLADIYKEDDRISDPGKKAEIVKRTCEKLKKNKYLTYSDEKYLLTEKAQKYIKENSLNISWADIKIYRMIEKADNSLTIEAVKSSLSNEREQGIIIGRLKKLETEGYVKYENGTYKKTSQGEEKIAEFINEKDREKHTKRALEDKKSEDFFISDYSEEQNKKSSLDYFKLQNWDKTNIIEKAENNIWSEEIFTKKSQDLDQELMQKKIASIQKRLFTLEEMGLAEHIGEGRFYLKDSLYERIELLKDKKKKNIFSAEQKEVIKALAQFLNLTDGQIERYMYKENNIICRSDINNLLKQGCIEEYKRDLKNNGSFEKIYYLTTDGKKAASHLTGIKTDKIYSSKVHGKTNEIRHDLLIYSAYKDLEEKLESEGYRIINAMTDKQMKSKDMTENGRQRVEYPDLYVEIEDIKTGEKSFKSIEIDCGYRPKTIKSKAENIENLVWYTDTEKQYRTITNTLKNADVTLISI